MRLKTSGQLSGRKLSSDSLGASALGKTSSPTHVELDESHVKSLSFKQREYSPFLNKSNVPVVFESSSQKNLGLT